MNRRLIVYLACALSVMGVIDCVMTLVNVGLGATEGNPLMAFLITRSPAMFVFLKCLILPGMLFLALNKVSASVHIRWLVPVLVVTNIVYALVMLKHGITFFYLTA